MIHALIKRYASALAALSVLAAIVAAPYLIPENPDSAVFRSGTLGLILLCAAYVPLSEAFSGAKLRTLICGLFWGLLFAFALSLGSELMVYDGLLPGFGSMIRRMAVPVLAAPLFGGVAARLMMAEYVCAADKKPARGGMLAYTLILLACWTPLLLAYFPGALNYDFTAEYWQYLAGIYSNRHPLLYLILNNGLIMLGGAVHSRTFGMLLSSIAHMIPFAAALAYALVFIRRRGAPAAAVYGILALFAIHPVFSMLSISTCKDTLFAAALLVLSLLAYEMIEDPGAFFQSRKKCALFAAMFLFTMHMRNNGMFPIAFLILALLMLLRGFRKKLLVLTAVSLLLSTSVTLCLEAIYPVTDQPSTQLFSLPAQQLVRAYKKADLTEEEKAEIRSYYTDTMGLNVYPHLADGAKGYLDHDRIDADPLAYLSLWARIGKRAPRVYLDAFLMLNIGSWYPDDVSHATIYQPSGLMVGYLETNRFKLSKYGIDSYCFLPAVRELAEKICAQNRYMRYPLLPILFCTATPLWLTLFACGALIAKGRGRQAACASGMLGLWLSYLMGPCTLPRYMLPLFCLAPVLLTLAFCGRKKDISEI